MLARNLFSLRDLMRQFSPELHQIFARYTGGITTRCSLQPQAASAPLGKEERDAFRSTVRMLNESLDEHGLVVTLAAGHRLKDALENPQTTWRVLGDICDDIERRLVDEQAAVLFFSMEPRLAEFYSDTEPFGPEVAAKFPVAIVDIEEAAKCLAFERGTASVFHLMRVMEIGLQALAGKLGFSLNNTNWQAIIHDVNGAIKVLPRSTAMEKDFLSRVSEAAIHLQHVKDAWRNGVMHPRESYTVTQAEEIYESTRKFMRTLPPFL